MLIKNEAGYRACLQIDGTSEQGYLVVGVQILPYCIGKSVQIALDSDGGRLPFKRGQRVSVALIRMDEVALAGPRCVVIKKVPPDRTGIPLRRFQDRKAIAVVFRLRQP